MIGAGGVLAPPDGYLERVQAICRERDVLFVADEVITGFGRCGSWFASERFGLDPDLLTCAKGITSGYLPLGALIVSPRVAEPFFKPGVMWRHGYTYSGHAAACAAALANLDVIEREGLVEGANELERELAAALAPLADHPRVREVRPARAFSPQSRSRQTTRRFRPGRWPSFGAGACFRGCSQTERCRSRRRSSRPARISTRSQRRSSGRSIRGLK